MTLSFGCGRGGEAYKSEVKSFRKALATVLEEIDRSVDSMRRSRYQLHYAIVALPESSGNATASSLSEPPSLPITAGGAAQLKVATGALNQFSLLLARLSGLDEPDQLTTGDLDALTAIFNQSHEFLTSEDVNHQDFINDSLLKSDLEKLGGWFSGGADLFKKLADYISRQKRGKAIRYGVRHGIPKVEDMVPLLRDIVDSLRRLEGSDLKSYKTHVALLLYSALRKKNGLPRNFLVRLDAIVQEADAQQRMSLADSLVESFGLPEDATRRKLQEIADEDDLVARSTEVAGLLVEVERLADLPPADLENLRKCLARLAAEEEGEQRRALVAECMENFENGRMRTRLDDEPCETILEIGRESTPELRRRLSERLEKTYSQPRISDADELYLRHELRRAVAELELFNAREAVVNDAFKTLKASTTDLKDEVGSTHWVLPAKTCMEV